jgi:hypothetical protein
VPSQGSAATAINHQSTLSQGSAIEVGTTQSASTAGTSQVVHPRRATPAAMSEADTKKSTNSTNSLAKLGPI